MVYGKLKFTPFWGKIVIKLSHLLLASSSALNIVIYSYKVQTQTTVFTLFNGCGFGKGIESLSLFFLIPISLQPNVIGLRYFKLYKIC